MTDLPEHIWLDANGEMTLTAPEHEWEAQPYVRADLVTTERTTMTNKIDWTKPVRTKKDHVPLRVLCTDRPGQNAVVCMRPDGTILTYNYLGGILAGGEPWVENVSEKNVRYVNFYEASAMAHVTRDTANRLAGRDRIACVRVEYEEGQFDD